MKPMTAVHSLALLIAAAFPTGCDRAPDVSSMSDVVPGAVGEAPVLGVGYNSVTGKVTGTTCFRPAVPRLVQQENQQAELKLDNDASSADLARLFAIDVGLTVPVFAGVDAGGSIHFASEFAKTSYNETTTLFFNLKAKAEQQPISPDFKETLTPEVSRVLTDTTLTPARREALVAEMCGDQYVAEVQYGLRFAAAAKTEFQNDFDKNTFAGGLKAEILGGLVSVTVDTELVHLTSDASTSVSMRFMQEGGRADDLLCILPAGKDGGTAGAATACPEVGDDPAVAATTDGRQNLFLQCSYKDRDECFKVFRRMYRYVNSIKAAVDQGGNAGAAAVNLIPIKYLTRPYPKEGAFANLAFSASDQQLADLSAAASGWRIKLMGLIADADAHKQRLANLARTVSWTMSVDDVKRYNDARRALDQALVMGTGFLDACFQLPLGQDDRFSVFLLMQKMVDDCRNHFNTLADLVKPGGALAFDARLLDPSPQTFAEWCLYAQLNGILSTDDRQTVEALLRLQQFAAPQPFDGDQLRVACKAAEAGLAARSGLTLAGQGIASVRPLVPLADGLRTLDLSHNKIASLTALTEARHACFERLDLSWNALSDLTELQTYPKPAGGGACALVASHNLFSRLPDFSVDWPWTTVDLSHNAVQTVPARSAPGAPALTTLDLSFNPLTSVPGLGQLQTPHLQLVLHGVESLDACPFPDGDPLGRRCDFGDNP